MKLAQKYFEFVEPRTAKYKCLVEVLHPVAAITEATHPAENVPVCKFEKQSCVPVSVAAEPTQCQECVPVYNCEHNVNVVACHAETSPPGNAVIVYASLKTEDFVTNRPPDVQVDIPVPIDRDKSAFSTDEYHATDSIVQSSPTSLEENDENDVVVLSCDFIDAVDELICCDTKGKLNICSEFKLINAFPTLTLAHVPTPENNLYQSQHP